MVVFLLIITMPPKEDPQSLVVSSETVIILVNISMINLSIYWLNKNTINNGKVEEKKIRNGKKFDLINFLRYPNTMLSHHRYQHFRTLNFMNWTKFENFISTTMRLNCKDIRFMTPTGHLNAPVKETSSRRQPICLPLPPHAIPTYPPERIRFLHLSVYRLR